MEKKDVVAAISTYDHLLWQAIINLGEKALSAHFSQKDNSVRVVYDTGDFDPVQNFRKIEEEISRLILANLEVKKTANSWFRVQDILDVCTNRNYETYLFNTLKIEIAEFREADETVFALGAYSGLLIVGEGTANNFCCPCINVHLKNTGELRQFKIKLFPPERVGENKYEFRFSVSE